MGGAFPQLRVTWRARRLAGVSVLGARAMLFGWGQTRLLRNIFFTMDIVGFVIAR
jgi:hypothetical protein